MIEQSECPACQGADLDVFYEQKGVPSHSVKLMPDRQTALTWPTGDLRIAFCRTCGFVFNTRFDVALNAYAQDCEETQGFSPHFQLWIVGLAQRVVDTLGLHGKTMLEIGCGKGEFLALVAELSGGRGIGIDPAYIPGRLATAAADRLTFYSELFTADHTWLLDGVDALAHRHTLEHIAPVAEHVRSIRQAIGDRSMPIFFELPETLRVLREGAFWDVYYEHCSYFTPGSLARLMRREGFDVTELALDYDDQYTLCFGAAGDGSSPQCDLEDDLEATAAAVEHFRVAVPERLEELAATVRAERDRGGRTVIWGAGSKGVAFLTTLGVDDAIELAVDINPHKQGKFMPGTAQEVVGPQQLVEHQPTLVLAMNPVYCDEIRDDLARIGVNATVVGV
ncbi:MAG: class I SAM-dependent methyltransferase [Acidimicrobiia bacterium]